MIDCPVEGCDFYCAGDADAEKEELEQHVRWIHLPNQDFGPDPFPAMMNFLINGIIRPDEFGETASAIMNEAMPEYDPGWRAKPVFFWTAGISTIVSYACLAVLVWLMNPVWLVVFTWPIFVALFLGSESYYAMVRHGLARPARRFRMRAVIENEEEPHG